MSYEPVDIYIKDQSNAPLEGAVARLFNHNGTRAHGQYTSDVTGRVRLLLPSGFTYQMRFYKFGVSFSPIQFEVLEAPSKNTFDVKGETFVWPAAKDARLCTASGYFRDVTGSPKSYQDLHFVADFSPFVLDGSAVAAERRSVRTDEKGWVEVTLIRNAIYGVTMEGWEDQFRRITVPDTASVNLPFLLFPRLERIETTADLPVVVRKGKTVEVPLRVFTTDLRETENISDDLSWTTSDPDKVLITSRSANSLTLTGVARGTAELRAERLTYMQGGDPPVYYPDTPLQGVPIPVSVV